MLQRLSILLALALAFCANLASCADVVQLEGGGRVVGEVVREEKTSRSDLAIESRWGRIVFQRKQVESLTAETPAHTEYRRRAPTVSDTADSQFALAMWCRDNGLADEMREHLTRVVELSPDHEQARLHLGYQRVGEQWLTRNERLAARGLVRSKGDFRTRQEIEILQRQEMLRQIELDWKKKVQSWRHDLNSRDAETSRAASEALASVTDPAAASSLVEQLTNENDPRVKQLLLRTIGAIPTRSTRHALVLVAIQDDDPEARATAIEQLVADGRPGLLQPFVAALKSRNNVTINRAADAIHQLGSPTAMAPLIEALVTQHSRRVGSDSGGDTYSFNNATGQYSFGGGGPRIDTKEIRNPRVLQALVNLSGENFAYDVPRWRAWLASQQIAQQVDLRRDP